MGLELIHLRFGRVRGLRVVEFQEFRENFFGITRCEDSLELVTASESATVAFRYRAD